MRKIIAKRLLESKLTLPHSYMAIEIEMDSLMATRAKFNTQNASKVVLDWASLVDTQAGHSQNVRPLKIAAMCDPHGMQVHFGFRILR